MKFSQIEKEHLLKAWVAISFAFTVLNTDLFSINFVIFFLISLFTVGIGFLLHEIAHKLVAQKYGCWAEFRADDRMLLFAVLSSFLGFIFIAPGAVIIHGHVTNKKNGHISLAGPMTNIILSLIFLVLLIYFPIGILKIAFNYGFRINAYIAMFNLIPFMNFDGVKILRWSKPIYSLTALFSLLLVILPVA